MNTHFEIGLFVSFTPQISFGYMYIENHQIWRQNVYWWGRQKVLLIAWSFEKTQTPKFRVLYHTESTHH